jgi:hypothetical protein
MRISLPIFVVLDWFTTVLVVPWIRRLNRRMTTVGNKTGRTTNWIPERHRTTVHPMPRDLHITNGDGAGDLLKASGLGGDVLPWRDTMFEGPFPAGLNLSETSALRARYLAAVGLPVDDVLRDLEARDAALRRAPDYDRITLWFEHDLLDQLQLLQLLDWFAAADIGKVDVGIVCIGDFPGIDPFRGLGQLSPEQIASLEPQRAPVTDVHLRLGREGWAAFRAPDPRAIETFLSQNLTPLPFMGAALKRHLEEFPSVREGLGRTHLQVLRLIADGVTGPVELFAEIMNRETVLFMGDWSTFRRIGELFRPQEPLLRCPPFGVFRWPPQIGLPLDAFRAQKLDLTDKGHRVLAGDGGRDPMRGFDYWLGGVHVENGIAPWRWNAETGRLQAATPT